jgi:hypothetical protein
MKPSWPTGIRAEKLDEQLAQQRAELARAEAEVAALAAVLEREAAGEKLGDWLQQQGLADARSYGRRYRLRHSGKPRWKPCWASGSMPVPHTASTHRPPR